MRPSHWCAHLFTPRTFTVRKVCRVFPFMSQPKGLPKATRSII
ncbi:hypothetical protein APX70_200455 [Pseudomonas syringae pv. maculicola]|uniref:Uncharacterized protein n=1 Tax=Pseudomonas syringae pv. maculicola TaxID=59511 RepID=A0A3M2ZUH4_PSEYM|nr:hypothetical protein APX70_200455 [Pseudomonas syringae pv. maculicola]